MAKGDFIVFDKFYGDLCRKEHDFSNDTFQFVIINSLPAATVANNNLSNFNQVTVGGNYTGAIVATVSLTESVGKATVDITNNPSWAQHANNPTNAVGLLVFNNTNANKKAIGVVDLTDDGGSTPVDMSVDNLNVTINAAGLLDIGK